MTREEERSYAIAHKDFAVRGGGEFVARQLAKLFDGPLYVGHRNMENEPDSPAIPIREIAPDSLYHRLIDRGGVARAIGNMLLWRDYGDAFLGEFDTVITSGNEPLWFKPRDDQTLVAYTHSTPRHMYDLHHHRDGVVHRTYLQAQQLLYESNVRRPDLWVANSDLVARRLQLYFNIPDEQIRVVYPPTDTASFSPDDARTDRGMFLYFGRLVGHKNVDELIEAWNTSNIDAELVIAGKGDARGDLEAMAGDNIRFTGFVNEQRKRELYSQAQALIYPPENEDFGMVPVEAMAAGTPVIGVEDGFTQFQIEYGKNGITYERGVNGLRRALSQFLDSGVDWSAKQIAAFAAENFGADRFEREMQQAVRDAEEIAAIEPGLENPVEERLVADGGD